jgi:membrane peptidoglycan carboxypeptidase
MSKNMNHNEREDFFASITTKFRNRSKQRKEKRESEPKSAKHIGRRILRTLLYLLVTGLILGVVVAVAGVIYLLTLMQELPTPEELANFSLIESTRIYDKDGNLLYEVHGDERREKVDLENIPKPCIDALLAAEDAGFYSHGGFSWRGIMRSVYLDAMRKISGSGSIVGGSTITQQFVKNAYLTRDKTIERKLKELILAMQVENAFTKDEILEMYLNAIPYGSNAHGIQTAAKSFFGKDVSELSLSQCALLATLPQAPSYYSPYGSHTDALMSRYRWVLSRMHELNMIDQLLYETSASEDVLATIQPFRQDIVAPHFVFYVKEILEERYGTEQVEKGGLQVYTTLDPKLQEIAERAVQKGIEGPLLQYNATNAALVALEPKTGNIVAMVGSRDYFMDEVDGQVNITTSLQQPGSSFKPFAYAGMFLKGRGIGPGTILWDVETNFGNNYMPGNFEGTFWGPVSVRKALAGSRNIPAIKAGYLGGIKETVEMANRMGLSTFEDATSLADHAGMSYALGTLEVTPLDMAVGYATFANNGYNIPSNAILKVTDSNGNMIDEFETPHGVHVIDPENPARGEQVAFLINDILSDSSARPAGWNVLSIPGHTVAAKTGTSNAKKDNVNYPQDIWTVGYTPSLVAVVWGGNTRNGVLTRNASGLMGITPTWHQFMEEALADTPDESFIKPDLIKEITISKSSGFLPGANTPSSLLTKDYFADFSIPEAHDQGYMSALVDRNTGLLMNEFCPDPDPATYVYQNAHSVLYYLNQEDPQFSRWEPPVRGWLVNKATDPAEGDVTETPAEGTESEAMQIVYVASPDEIPKDSCTENMLENWEDRAKVSFVYPYQGGKLSLGENTVMLDIEAEFGIRSIEYFFDGSLTDHVTRRPYEEGRVFVPMDTEIGSTHTIRVIATDNEDNRTMVENTIQIANDATPPDVQITEPRNNKKADPGETISISVTANDANSEIRTIEILFDGSLITNLNGSGTYSFNIPTNTSKGDHTITARAFDSEDNASIDTITIDVSGKEVEDNGTDTSTQTTLNLQVLGSDEITIGQDVSLLINLGGNMSNVAKVKLYANGERLDVLFDVSNGMSTVWTPKMGGDYVLSAEAVDTNDTVIVSSNTISMKVNEN